MAKTAQHFGDREEKSNFRTFNKIDSPSLDEKIERLAALSQKIVVQTKVSKERELCGKATYATDECPRIEDPEF